MSDTKNHKLAIKAIIEAHRTPGKMREIMLTILADKPSAIANAWEEVKMGEAVLCIHCLKDTPSSNSNCEHCGVRISIIKQSESP